MRPLLRLPAVLAPIVLAACLETEPIPEVNYGVIGLNAVVTATDTVLFPEALFYRSPLLRLPTSRVGDDACVIDAFPPQGGEGPLPRFLDAGESVAVSTATLTRFLVPTSDGNREFYELAFGDTLPFRPGEEVTITVPGAPGGFSNGTISVFTAHAFTLDPVNPQPPEDSPLELRWTPAGDDGTKMLVQLRYGVDQITPDRQIFCELVDDGEAEVPAALVNQWRTAATGSREVTAARWRVAVEEVNDGILVVVSAFEVEGAVSDGG